jgi:hypothetical protein
MLKEFVFLHSHIHARNKANEELSINLKIYTRIQACMPSIYLFNSIRFSQL